MLLRPEGKMPMFRTCHLPQLGTLWAPLLVGGRALTMVGPWFANMPLIHLPHPTCFACRLKPTLA